MMLANMIPLNWYDGIFVELGSFSPNFFSFVVGMNTYYSFHVTGTA